VKLNAGDYSEVGLATYHRTVSTIIARNETRSRGKLHEGSDELIKEARPIFLRDTCPVGVLRWV
jgi:hypothetical protein